jgi:hypothetical protein
VYQAVSFTLVWPRASAIALLAVACPEVGCRLFAGARAASVAAGSMPVKIIWSGPIVQTAVSPITVLPSFWYAFT